jgi:hypothetical protein
MKTPVLMSTSKVARKNNTNTTHLTRDVGERNNQGTKDRYGSGDIGIIAITNKIWYSKFSEFSEIGR